MYSWCWRTEHALNPGQDGWKGRKLSLASQHPEGLAGHYETQLTAMRFGQGVWDLLGGPFSGSFGEEPSVWQRCLLGKLCYGLYACLQIRQGAGFLSSEMSPYEYTLVQHRKRILSVASHVSITLECLNLVANGTTGEGDTCEPQLLALLEQI